MTNRIYVLQSPVDVLSMQQTLQKIEQCIIDDEQIQHVVVNAAKLVNMRKDTRLREAVENCEIINADGMAVVWAAKLLGTPLPERVTGIDLMQKLVELSANNNYRIYFFGGAEEVISKLIQIYSKKYGPNIIAGFRNGYFKKEEEEGIAQQIKASKADILFVGISSPTKEIFLKKYKSFMGVPFIMGVGGSFDVVAGKTKRAPHWMQKSGLEWFYRFAQEPGRMWKRYLVTNSWFLYYLLCELLFTKKRKREISRVGENSKSRPIG